MRIGLLTTSFPRHPGDVAGQFVLGFAQALAARGHELEVLAPEPHDVATRTLPSFPGVSLSWVHYAPHALERTFYGAGVLDNLRHDPRAVLGLAPFVLSLSRDTLARAGRWDALVSHWALPCALVAGLARQGRPHLAVLHSADVFLLERLPLRRMLATRIAQQASALVCSSRNLRERFLRLLDPVLRVEVSARTHVCAMGIVPSPQSVRSERPAPVASSTDARAPGLTILALGRLVAIKGLHHAIEATAGLPDVELVIAGDGPARGQLEQLARARRAHVRFVGEVQGDAKHALFASAHAFVLPSVELASGRTEGMPTTLLEAMDAGLPVIASRTGGVTDVVEHEDNGLLLPSGDTMALRAAIERLREPALRTRLARAGRRTAREFHWPNLAPHFERLLGIEHESQAASHA